MVLDPKPIHATQVKFARKNRHLVPFAYKVNSLNELGVGADSGLDAICDGIISGRPFLVN